jgi:hypothetical protein
MEIINFIKNIILYFQLNKKIKTLRMDIEMKFQYRIGPFLQIYKVFYLDENEYTGVDKIDLVKISEKSMDMANFLVENGLKLDYTINIDKIDNRNYLVIFYPSFFRVKGWKLILEILGFVLIKIIFFNFIL